MIRKSIIDRVNRYAKNRGLKVTEIKEEVINLIELNL